MIPFNSELSTAARIRLIQNALRDCGQDVTHEAVAAQFKRETGKTLPPPEQEIPWATLVQFPSGEAVVTGKKCKVCGFVMVLTKSDPERDECFCCAHTIPLHCLDCGGSGVVDTFARVDDGSSPKREPCMGCLGSGRRG